jgi:hypothetical protein
MYQLRELHRALSNPLKTIYDIQIQFVPHRQDSVLSLERQPMKAA